MGQLCRTSSCLPTLCTSSSSFVEPCGLETFTDSVRGSLLADPLHCSCSPPTLSCPAEDEAAFSHLCTADFWLLLRRGWGGSVCCSGLHLLQDDGPPSCGFKEALVCTLRFSWREHVFCRCRPDGIFGMSGQSSGNGGTSLKKSYVHRSSTFDSAGLLRERNRQFNAVIQAFLQMYGNNGEIILLDYCRSY